MATADSAPEATDLDVSTPTFPKPAPEPGNEPDPATPPAKPLPTPLVVALLVGLLGFIAYQTPRLLAEVRALQEEWYQDVHTRIIGYEGIDPHLSFAHMPRDWFRQDGESILIWAAWEPGLGHRWFRVGDGEVERDQLSWAYGRDVLRAIDRPVVEVGGGARWERIPEDTLVYGIETTSPPTAYPALLLNKVLVVNEQVQPTPMLVLFTPLVPPEKAVATFDPRLKGHRVTMGTAGYLYGGHPLLYDRGTESLWAPDPTGLVAIAGPLRGERLARLAPVNVATWSDWQSSHPDTRLVVGADRSEAPPRE